MTSGLPVVVNTRSPLPPTNRKKTAPDGGQEERPDPGQARLSPRDGGVTPGLHRRTKSTGGKKTRPGEVLVHKSWPLGGATDWPSPVELSSIKQLGGGAKPLPPIQRKAPSGPVTEFEAENGVKPEFNNLPSLQLHPNGKKRSFYGEGVAAGNGKQTEKKSPKETKENQNFVERPKTGRHNQSSNTGNRFGHDTTNDAVQSTGDSVELEDISKAKTQSNHRTTVSSEGSVQNEPMVATKEEIISINDDNVVRRNSMTTQPTGASLKGLFSGIVGRMRFMARRDRQPAEVESEVSRHIEQHREEASRLTQARSTARLRQDATLQEKLIERRLKRKAMLEESSQRENPPGTESSD